MFSLVNRQKSKAGEKPYMPGDRASEALQNLIYRYSPKLGRGLQLRVKVCSYICTFAGLTKINLFDSYVVR